LFLFWRDGRRAPGLILRMGWPGLVVAACYAAASIALVVALNLTTVANVLVIMSTAPFLSALFGWMVLGERVSVVGCLAILASIAGVAIMVSDSYGHGSVLGDLIALSIALSQAVAIVVIRGHRTVRMTPAMALATLIAAIVALPAANPFEVTRWDFVLLCLFGAAQLGLGLALFSYGAPLVPAAEAALLNVLEPILGPVWVWLVLSERPSGQALVGAGIVLAALMLHLAVGLGRKRRTDDAHAR
jgi:drug/metabolite transporter (DMT)-like permease